MATHVFPIARIVRTVCLPITMLLLISCSITAQPPSDACAKLPRASVPEADKPTLATLRAAGVVTTQNAQGISLAKSCDAMATYYDESPGHFRRALACAMATDRIFAKGVDMASKTEAPDRDLVLVVLYAMVKPFGETCLWRA
jgi:hypothetical protein